MVKSCSRQKSSYSRKIWRIQRSVPVRQRDQHESGRGSRVLVAQLKAAEGEARVCACMRTHGTMGEEAKVRNGLESYLAQVEEGLIVLRVARRGEQR